MTETTAVDGMITGPIGLALVVAGEREGIHGHEHWRRVGENAMDLAHEEGVSCHVALLFAILHDCCRENDGHDPGHGPRAAELAESLGHEALGITPDELRTLTYAMHHHDRAFGCQRFSDAGADARTAASDERPFSLQLQIHVASSAAMAWP